MVGADSAGIAGDVVYLGERLQKNNRNAEADALFQRAFELQRKYSTGDEVGVGNTNQKLAEIFHGKGRLPEAEELYRKALKAPDSNSDNGWSRSRYLNSLSQILEETDRLPEVEPLLRESVGIYLANQSLKEELNQEVVSGTANYLRAAQSNILFSWFWLPWWRTRRQANFQ